MYTEKGHFFIRRLTFSFVWFFPRLRESTPVRFVVVLLLNKNRKFCREKYTPHLCFPCWMRLYRKPFQRYIQWWEQMMQSEISASITGLVGSWSLWILYLKQWEENNVILQPKVKWGSFREKKMASESGGSVAGSPDSRDNSLMSPLTSSINPLAGLPHRCHSPDTTGKVCSVCICIWLQEGQQRCRQVCG